MGRKVYLTRSISISAAHRLHKPDVSDEDNAKIYDKCNRTHGHNYKIEVTICGEPDEYGMVMNITELKDIMNDVIMTPMDHRRIDEDIEYFRTIPSTGENLAIYIWDEMNKKLKTGLLYEVRIHETAKNVIYYRGEMV